MGSSSSANLWVLLGLGLAGILIMTRKLKKVVKEDFGAFVERFQLLPPPQPAPPKAPHPLTGLSFSVSDLKEHGDGYLPGKKSLRQGEFIYMKCCGCMSGSPWGCALSKGSGIGANNSLRRGALVGNCLSRALRKFPILIPRFDIDGFVTGFGNPDWARTHEAASQTSPVLSALIEGGATCIGKTVVDEMAFGISGENKHYGTPTNAAAPARIPGGSSSGGAVAVAASLVDFSLGIDTDGGVRVPAGYCGVIGFRPSHGALSHIGVIPVSSSFDTVGWFAKDPNILRRVGHVLLQVPFAVQRNPRNIIIADDYFQMLKISADRVTQVVIKSTEKLFGRQVLRHENLGDYFDAKVPSLKAFYGKKSNGELPDCGKGEHKVMGSLYGASEEKLKRYKHEFKHNHEEWISSAKPTLDPVIRAQIHESLEIEDKEIESCHTIRNEMRMALNPLLKDDGILVIPTNADPPPKLGHREILSEDRLSRAFSLLSLASMSGCCQVTVPLGFYDKCPVSVSLVARHGGDRFLLDTVQTMYASLQEQADIISKSKLSTNAISQETSAEIAKEKGNQAFKDKQYQKAISSYTEAIKLSGNNATYYSNRAAAHLEIGSFLQAEADCTKAISLDKKNVKAYLRRGTAREMLGYYKEAIEDFSYALVLEPTNKRAAVSAERCNRFINRTSISSLKSAIKSNLQTASVSIDRPVSSSSSWFSLPTRTTSTFLPLQEPLEGKIITKLPSSISHNGIRLTVNGSVTLQVRGGSAGVIESLYGVLKPIPIV
ncbi:hypothetical protein TEA_022490 [Camellia sinensis var. sinensis]|uniref:Amidase domain-containing protein n=1 Tax=Camellia sinensis var. sinensis TaxID=542762 RepID=A0A4S4EPL2_CAMSN|nr:hypothetical protein TEA_022490 [Camellia sinensis var. sinensis]